MEAGWAVEREGFDLVDGDDDDDDPFFVCFLSLSPEWHLLGVEPVLYGGR